METVETNGVHTAADAEMADCDGEKVVTMMDVLQEQQDFEEDANAVLGASDEKECTYSKGYIKRQAIYACLTCCSEAKTDPTSRAGVCLACSLNCHENHELIELYTKRNFRCDCGNPKFNSNPCQFTAEKPDLNEENVYNQNFSGLYCSCQRPYPDPENPVDEEMIQCIICEDWLHSSHLDAVVPANDQYSEMICKSCMEKNEFLHDYSSFAVMASETEEIDVTNNSLLETTLSNENENKKDSNDDPIEKIITPTAEELLKEQVDVAKESEPKEEDEIKPDNEKQKDDEERTTEETNKIDQESNETEMSIINSQVKESTGTKLEEPNKSESVDENVAVEQMNNEISNKTEQSGRDEKIDESPTKSREEINPSDDDNKEIEAINKLIGEESTSSENNTSEEKKDSKDDEQPMSTTNITASADEPTENNKNEEIQQNENNKNEEIQQNEKKNEEIEQNEGNAPKVTEDPENETTDTKPDEDKKNGDIDMKDDETKNNSDNLSNGSLEIKRKLSTEETIEGTTNKRVKLDSCVRPKGQKRIFKGATFWPSNFRQKLCTCNECTTMYKDLSLLYIIDPEDTVSAYETLGKEKINGAPTQYEKGLEALSSLDRIQQINALTEYNNMRDKLLDFLKSFKDRKEVVKEEDIKAFFAGMKPKREPDGVYFCR